VPDHIPMLPDDDPVEEDCPLFVVRWIFVGEDRHPLAIWFYERMWTGGCNVRLVDIAEQDALAVLYSVYAEDTQSLIAQTSENLVTRLRELIHQRAWQVEISFDVLPEDLYMDRLLSLVANPHGLVKLWPLYSGRSHAPDPP